LAVICSTINCPFHGTMFNSQDFMHYQMPSG
jgi:hypothetical protein